MLDSLNNKVDTLKDKIINLKERNSTGSALQTDVKIWEKAWLGISMFFQIKVKQGVIVLFGKNLDSGILDKVIDDNGRYKIPASVIFIYQHIIISKHRKNRSNFLTLQTRSCLNNGC